MVKKSTVKGQDQYVEQAQSERHGQSDGKSQSDVEKSV
jgi:hypothetical protein